MPVRLSVTTPLTVQERRMTALAVVVSPATTLTMSAVPGVDVSAS